MLVCTAIVVCIAMCGASAHAVEIRRADQDSTRLAFLRDPDLLYFAPGNDGSVYFKDTPSTHPGNVQPWQDHYCDGSWMELDSSDYALRLTSELPTSRTAFWRQQQSYLASLTMSGTASAWIINDELVAELKSRPVLIDDITSHCALFRESDINPPSVIFDLANWDSDALQVVDKLTSGLTGQAIGAHVRMANFNTVPRRDWTFIIADEEIIPETWRGQAAPAWLQHKFRHVPVIISPARPDFQRDIIWLSCGAAGMWYRPLAKAGTTQNEDGAIHLRASTTFLNRFRNMVRLTPRPLHPILNFSLVAQDEAIACVIPSHSGQVTIDLPRWLQGQTVSRVWFNPATDENIIQPLTRVSRTISFQQPDDNLWVYSLTKTTAAADTASTVSAIHASPE